MKFRNNTLYDFFSEKQAPVRNNYGSTKSYIYTLKNSCDTNLIQCGNEKEEKKRGNKFTNRYLLKKATLHIRVTQVIWVTSESVLCNNHGSKY